MHLTGLTLNKSDLVLNVADLFAQSCGPWWEAQTERLI